MALLATHSLRHSRALSRHSLLHDCAARAPEAASSSAAAQARARLWSRRIVEPPARGAQVFSDVTASAPLRISVEKPPRERPFWRRLRPRPRGDEDGAVFRRLLRAFFGLKRALRPSSAPVAPPASEDPRAA